MEAGESFADALPWLKKYRGAVIVIKVGGHAMVDQAARSGIIKDIVTLKFLGLKPIIVHGGGPEIDAMMKRMGKTPKFVSGLRVTDVNGVMMDSSKKDTLISQLNIAQCYDLIDKGIISKGMIPKILSSISVVKCGIQSVHVINGNIPHALLRELLTDQGVGTCITRE